MTRSPVAAPMGLAVSVVRPVSLAYSASTRSRASRPASARACPRPSSVSGLSAWYPCTRPSRFHCVSPWRMRITRASATTRPQPTVEQPPARAGRLGEHAGVRLGPLQANLEAHQLVPAERLDRQALSGAPLRERAVQSDPPRAQALDRDDHVAGGDSRFLRRPALQHVGHRAIPVFRSRTDAEHRQPRNIFRAGALAALVRRRLGGAQFHIYPMRREQSPQRQLARRAQPLVEIPPQPEPRHFLGETLDPVLVHADAGAAVTKPQRAHQVVERLLPPRLLPNRQIEAQRDEAALDVVAHGGVRRILVLAVVLDPRVEARFGEALLRPARRAQMRGDRAPEQLEIVFFPDQPAPDQRKIVVVGGDALERPEELRVALAVEVVRSEGRWPDAFHVPGVEILVAAKPEKSAVALAHLRLALPRKVVARAQQRGGGAMLKAPVAFADRGDEQHVALHGRGPAAEPRSRRFVPEADVVFAHAFQIAAQPSHVGAMAAGDDEVV